MKLLACTLLWTAGLCAATKRRNVLFIAVDDMRPTLGAYNFSLAHTPNIDRLAKEAVTFKRAYVQFAVCSPLRNSFMTGRRPDTTQVLSFWNSFRDLPDGKDWLSLPGYFRHHGYITLGSGKIYHPGWPFDNDYNGSWSPDWPYFSPECQPEGHLPICPSSVSVNVTMPKCLTREPPTGNLSVCVADVPANESRKEYQLEDMLIRDNCIDQLRIAKSTNKNFFIACGFHRPHVPHITPAEFWDYFPKDLDDIPLAKHTHLPIGMPEVAYHFRPMDLNGFEDLKYNGSCNATRARLYRRAYYASVAHTDYNIGLLLDELDKLGLRDDTAVLVFGDHGWHLGELDEWGKLTNFELSVRIPMILRAPWLPDGRGKVAEGLAEAVDFYPTLIELAGLPDPKGLGQAHNGTSLVPMLRNPSDTSVKTAAYSQIAKWKRDDPTDGTPHFAPRHTEVMGYSVRVKDWRYTAWFGVLKLRVNLTDVIARELYSHEDDDGDFDFAGETINIVDDPAHEQIVQELHGMIENYVQLWPADHNGRATKEAANRTGSWNLLYA